MPNTLPALTAIALIALAAVTSAQAQTPPALPRLHAQGTRIVDPQGNAVRLRGINLGSWLLQEMWMTPVVQDPPSGSPYSKIPDHVTLYKVLEERLGASAMQSVRAAWRSAWLQETDFDRIKSAGFNHVRLPFLWSVVEEPGGMDLLRNAVAWANARGLYVILDMHGMPGGQSNDHTTGQAGVNKFFYDPANVEKAEQVWTAVAREFGSNPGVAAFDLINEPIGAPNPATLHLVYNRLYQAVRKVAPDTMVIVDDGYKGFDTTPHPDVSGWTNLVFSLHFYNFDAQTTQDHLTKLDAILPRILELRGYRNAPVYIGEFNIEPHSSPETMEKFIQTLDDHDLSWAMWTYKTVTAKPGMGYWGLYQNTEPVVPLNPFTDSEAELKARIDQVRTGRLAPVSELLAVFQTYLRQP